MGKDYVIGIDLGGTKISGAFSDYEGNILSKYTIPTNAFEGDQSVLQRIISVIEKVVIESGKSIEDVNAIGIGSPGPLDIKEGKIIETANLPFKNFKLVEPIEKRFNVKTYLDNDANVAAIGEFMMGAGKGTNNIVYITVSTGIGGGAIINGKIYRGNTYNALEVGHTTVLPDGPKCKCGNYGCAEVMASGTAIGRRGTEAVMKGLKTSLSQYEKVTSYEVFQEAKKGDKAAQDVLNTALPYLGICVANVITNFDPEMVVIGGGVSKAGDIVFEKIQTEVDKRCFKSMANSCRIVPAGLGTDAGVIGAVALAIMESR